jgi:hypothetical protein
MCLPRRVFAPDCYRMEQGSLLWARGVARNGHQRAMREPVVWFALHDLSHCIPNQCGTAHGCLMAPVPA